MLVSIGFMVQAVAAVLVCCGGVVWTFGEDVDLATALNISGVVLAGVGFMLVLLGSL